LSNYRAISATPEFSACQPGIYRQDLSLLRFKNEPKQILLLKTVRLIIIIRIIINIVYGITCKVQKLISRAKWKKTVQSDRQRKSPVISRRNEQQLKHVPHAKLRTTEQKLSKLENFMQSKYLDLLDNAID